MQHLIALLPLLTASSAVALPFHCRSDVTSPPYTQERSISFITKVTRQPSSPYSPLSVNNYQLSDHDLGRNNGRDMVLIPSQSPVIGTGPSVFVRNGTTAELSSGHGRLLLDYQLNQSLELGQLDQFGGTTVRINPGTPDSPGWNVEVPHEGSQSSIPVLTFTNNGRQYADFYTCALQVEGKSEVTYDVALQLGGSDAPEGCAIVQFVPQCEGGNEAVEGKAGYPETRCFTDATEVSYSS